MGITDPDTEPRDVAFHPSLVTRDERWERLSARGGTAWITGLPGAGKSTLAAAAEAELVARGKHAMRLDGDNLRLGLNADLSFSPRDRHENVRRTAHVACLLADAGVIALAALVSPYARGRALARETHEAHGLPFVEVFVDTPPAVCEARDPKGLYARARRGEITDLTGVDATYEPPAHADLVLTPGPVAELVRRLLGALSERGADVG